MKEFILYLCTTLSFSTGSRD